jgi:hypothetical protein
MRSGFLPVAFPSHDLGSISKEGPLETDKKGRVGSDDVSQVRSPCIQNCGSTIPVGLLFGDIPYNLSDKFTRA